jgi:hypothetical protein
LFGGHPAGGEPHLLDHGVEIDEDMLELHELQLTDELPWDFRHGHVALMLVVEAQHVPQRR